MKTTFLWTALCAMVLGCFFGSCETPTTSSTTVTYSDVSSIINAKCVGAGCHNSTTAADNVDCSSYAAMAGTNGNKDILTKASNSFYDRVFVTAPLMPAGGALSQSEKDLLQAWVDNNYAE